MGLLLSSYFSTPSVVRFVDHSCDLILLICKMFCFSSSHNSKKYYIAILQYNICFAKYFLINCLKRSLEIQFKKIQILENIFTEGFYLNFNLQSNFPAK